MKRVRRFKMGGEKILSALLVTMIFSIHPSGQTETLAKPLFGQTFPPNKLRLLKGKPYRVTTTRIKLVDAVTGKAIAHTPVQINSNNGVRCKSAPCPMNDKQWSGATDASGVLVLPADVIQFDTYIFAGRYSGRISLIKTKNPTATRIVKLSRVIFEDARLFQKKGETPLMQAAKKADIEKVTELLAQGAQVNAKDEEGSTALLYAQSPAHSLDAITDTVMGARVSALNAFNEPFNELTKMMQLLIERGADVNAANKRGETALMRAAAAMNPRAVFALLESGANLDAADANGNTALLSALLPIADTPSLKTSPSLDEKRKRTMSFVAGELIDAKLIHIVKALIEKGANLNAKNRKGETALTLANRIAEHFGHTRLITLLQPSGAQAPAPEGQKLSEPALLIEPGSWLLEHYRSGGIRGIYEAYFVVSDGTVISNGTPKPLLPTQERKAITEAVANLKPGVWKEPRPEPRCGDQLETGWILIERPTGGSEKVYNQRCY